MKKMSYNFSKSPNQEKNSGSRIRLRLQELERELEEIQSSAERKIENKKRLLNKQLSELTYIIDTKEAEKGGEISDDLRSHVKTMLGTQKIIASAEEREESSPHLKMIKKHLEGIQDNLGKKVDIKQLQNACKIKKEIVELKIAREKEEKRVEKEIKSLEKLIVSSESEDEQQKVEDSYMIMEEKK
jgi:hypothetical protein